MKLYKLLLFILYNILSIFLCKIGIVEGIVGGQEVQNNEHLYTVSVQVDNVHICGGAILDERYVLTAAHCVIGEDDEFIKKPIKIITGVSDLNSNTPPIVPIDVEIIFVPKEFKRINTDSSSSNYMEVGDIAVLKLKQDISSNSNYQWSKLQLPEKEKNHFVSYANKVAHVSGFGTVNIDRGIKRNSEGTDLSRPISGKIKTAKSLVIDKRSCKKYAIFTVDNKHLCSQLEQIVDSDPSGTCDGDSGGPLVLNNMVIGILSKHNRNCNELVGIGLYTRVSSYKSFIVSAMTEEITLKDVRVAAYKEFQNEFNILLGSYTLVTNELVEVTKHL